jgi:sugar phosphate isomerase/epimerase
MKRRDFVKNASLTAAALAFPGAMTAMKGKKGHLGLQLYSVRDDMKTDPKGTLKKLATIGYKEVEGAGYNNGKFYGFTPKEFKSILLDNGLTMPSGHTGFTSDNMVAQGLNDNWKKTVADAAEVGQKFVISPWMADKDRTPDGLKKLCEGFNRAGEYGKTMGQGFGYHNHDFEFKKSGEELIYETLLKNTDPKLVTMEIDLYWVVYAGSDPFDWFKKHPGRFELYHVKDLAKTEKRETVEVGEGSINFAEIFKMDKLSGAKYHIIELEDYKTTPLQGVEVCYKNLAKLLK